MVSWKRKKKPDHIDHRKECGFSFKCYQKPLNSFKQGSNMHECLYTSPWAMEWGVDCRRQRGAGRPVRTLSQRCRSEKGNGVDWGAGGGDGQEGPVLKGARQN